MSEEKKATPVQSILLLFREPTASHNIQLSYNKEGFLEFKEENRTHKGRGAGVQNLYEKLISYLDRKHWKKFSLSSGIMTFQGDPAEVFDALQTLMLTTKLFNFPNERVTFNDHLAFPKPTMVSFKSSESMLPVHALLALKNKNVPATESDFKRFSKKIDLTTLKTLSLKEVLDIQTKLHQSPIESKFSFENFFNTLKEKLTALLSETPKISWFSSLFKPAISSGENKPKEQLIEDIKKINQENIPEEDKYSDAKEVILNFVKKNVKTLGFKDKFIQKLFRFLQHPMIKKGLANGLYSDNQNQHSVWSSLATKAYFQGNIESARIFAGIAVKNDEPMGYLLLAKQTESTKEQQSLLEKLENINPKPEKGLQDYVNVMKVKLGLAVGDYLDLVETSKDNHPLLMLEYAQIAKTPQEAIQYAKQAAEQGCEFGNFIAAQKILQNQTEFSSEVEQAEKYMREYNQNQEARQSTTKNFSNN